MKKFNKIYIEITNSCNLNCSFCSKNKRLKKYMSIDKFEHILKEIEGKTDIIYLHVTGEPLLHPNFKEILSLTENYNLKVNLTTNGTLLKEKINDLKQVKTLSKINISLHCETNKKNYFEDIFTAIGQLPENVIVIYRLWTLKDNKLDEKSKKIVEKLKEQYNLSPDIVDKLYHEKNTKISSTIYVDKDNQFEWPTITDKQTDGYCHALKTHIAILVDGTLVPCCLDAEGTINLGNIFKESFENILSGEKYQELKQSFGNRKPCEKLCKSCTYKLRKYN